MSIRVHALNVGEGDCYILDRGTSRGTTVIDICSGNLEAKPLTLAELMKSAKPKGNYGMAEKPTNPVDYMVNKGLTRIWRFILTHPDMDHMDGIKNLFQTCSVSNFWDSEARCEKPDFSNGRYKEEDWNFYTDLIGGQVSGVNVVKPKAGAKNKYWNHDDEEGGGDYVHIVSPNLDLIAAASKTGDTNDASYVIVYQSAAGKIVFPGDSHDATWKHVLEHHRALVADAAVLFAPHHGRKSDRDYSFLDVVKPRVSFFGCAPSEHLAYSAWDYRKLLFFTSNQCGNVHIYPNFDTKKVDVYIENRSYASDFNGGAEREQKDGYWHLCSV